MSIIVYWLDSKHGAQMRELPSTDLLPALKLAEELRKAEYRHVVISSELEDSVGKAGVVEVAPGYDWKKRRS